jgi:hypothetical protein
MLSGYWQGRRLPILLLEVQCKWCGMVFHVCRSCWRGQAYCGDACRISGKRHAHREAQRRYRRSAKGKKAHREAERRWRKGLSKKNKKIMDDRGSSPLHESIKLSSCSDRTPGSTDEIGPGGLNSIGECHFCHSMGKIVARFPRRGYGKGKYSARCGVHYP